jgi:hypothetical protein
MPTPFSDFISDGVLTLLCLAFQRSHPSHGIAAVLSLSCKHCLSSMPSAQIARLPAFIGRPKPGDISVSPDSFQPWPFSRSQTTALALEPPSPAFIEHMVSILSVNHKYFLALLFLQSYCATWQLQQCRFGCKLLLLLLLLRRL